MVEVLVTGGAGFIGSNFVRWAHAQHPDDHAAARAWITPLPKKLNNARVAPLLKDLRTLTTRLRHKKRPPVQAEVS